MDYARNIRGWRAVLPQSSSEVSKCSETWGQWARSWRSGLSGTLVFVSTVPKGAYSNSQSSYRVNNDFVACRELIGILREMVAPEWDSKALLTSRTRLPSEKAGSHLKSFYRTPCSQPHPSVNRSFNSSGTTLCSQQMSLFEGTSV